MSRRILPAAVVVAVALSATSHLAFAGLSRHVIAAFRGQLVITNGDLPEGKNDRDTIKKIKAARLKTITGANSGADGTAWQFHYTAFLSRKGATSLRLEFLDGQKLSADQSLDGINPKDAALIGDISISEDDGLTKGKTYKIELVNPKHHVVASATLTMK